MKTRLIVSALTLAALSFGSASSFAQDARHGGDQHRGGWQAQQPAHGAWQGAHDRAGFAQRAQAERWHERREWREHAARGYYRQPAPYYYQQPAPYYYEQPAPAYYPQPGYYSGQYADPDSAADVAFAAIVGGVLAQAIANH